jgi:hypothetical protein
MIECSERVIPTEKFCRGTKLWQSAFVADHDKPKSDRPRVVPHFGIKSGNPHFAPVIKQNTWRRNSWRDADAIDIFALGEDSDFKVCYLSLRSSSNYLHFPVFPAKIPESSDIDANKPNFQGCTLGSRPGI